MRTCKHSPTDSDMDRRSAQKSVARITWNQTKITRGYAEAALTPHTPNPRTVPPTLHATFLISSCHIRSLRMALSLLRMAAMSSLLCRRKRGGCSGVGAGVVESEAPPVSPLAASVSCLTEDGADVRRCLKPSLSVLSLLLMAVATVEPESMSCRPERRRVGVSTAEAALSTRGGVGCIMAPVSTGLLVPALARIFASLLSRLSCAERALRILGLGASLSAMMETCPNRLVEPQHT